jgi:HEAT repeat protein
MTRKLVVLVIFAITLQPALLEARGKKKTAPDSRSVAALEKIVECALSRDSACIRSQLDILKERGDKACTVIAARLMETEQKAWPELGEALVRNKCPQLVKLTKQVFAITESDYRGPFAAKVAISKNKALVEPIEKLIRTGRPYDKEKGCEALAILGDDKAVPTLVQAAGNGMFSVRLQAATALAVFPGDASRDKLCAMATQDSNSGVRIKAAESLGKLKDSKAVPCLITVLEDNAGRVKTAAHQALIAITELDVGLDPEAWTKWWKKQQPKKRGHRR